MTLLSVAGESGDGKENDHSDGIIGGVVAGLVLLAILVSVLILCRRKLCGTQACCATGGSTGQSTDAGPNTEVNHGDHHYEEIVGKKNSGGVVSSVYASVSPPADQLHYASVNFQNDSTTVLTDRNAPPDTDKSGSSTCDYSSISGTPTLYSTVIKPEGP
ncbi:CMRF35-like molecule 1 [Lates japonicus]|uniref:CMRF35-like molecule 1 n=1 Tax=Lates japonicus TaxID=270547 RepID=A0AAD3MWM1_LATJO|nr:CMRF35-like molecule 1 [Lates japonicus]